MEKLSEKCRRMFRGVIQAVMKPRPKQRIWEWIEEHVRVPMIVGSRAPGPLDTGLMPQWRGLLEKYADRRTRFFTLCKGARIGGTLFFGICLVLEKIARWPGPIGWLDPTRKTAVAVSRREIEPFLRECRTVYAEGILGKTTWTVLEKFFRSCVFSILGAGAITDLGGRQWELVIINEQDRIPNRAGDAPTPSQEATARSGQFEHTRKIVRNSTPFREAGLTWGEFLAGSQEYCYVPCPHCQKRQRLTFFKEPAEPDKWIRLLEEPTGPDRELFTRVKPAPDGNGWLCEGQPPTGRVWWPPELKDGRNGRWNADLVALAARYECAYCEAKIRPEQLVWMNDRYQWWSHNRWAPREHVSAHISALYSPWTTWGAIAKEWLAAQGIAAKLHAFWNLVLGLPFVSMPTKLTPKHIELLQKESPHYHRQFPERAEVELLLPVRPVCLTMHVDVQQTEFWWTLRLWLPSGERWLLAWGQIGSFADIRAIADREWAFDHGDHLPESVRWEKFQVLFGIIDTGYKAKRMGGVYEFLADQGGRWQGVKGGAFALGREKPITEEMVTFDYHGRGQVDVPLIKTNDFILQEHFTRYVLKERRAPAYRLPVTLDDHFVTQLTSPHLTKSKLPDGRTEDRWAYEDDPHLYDCEKYGEVLGFILDPVLLAGLREAQDAKRADLLGKLGLPV